MESTKQEALGEYEFNVGAHLCALRKLHNLSQRELAKRAGLTNGTISLIEQNRISPSVASLRKVLDGLSMSLAEFFSLRLPSKDQIFFTDQDLVTLTKGAVTYRQVGRRENLQILHERYEPGADTGDVMLCHKGEEGGVVISGTIEITVGDKKRVLKAGEAYHFHSDIPHRFQNPGNNLCIIVSACTPPWM